MTKLMITGSEALMQAAAASGVRICFANPGTTEMWLVSALDACPTVRAVLGMHETVCTGAADGYFRMARSPPLVLLHLGPGLANGLANLHNARRASSAVLVLVGDMASWHRGADPTLNMDIQCIAATVSGTVISIVSDATASKTSQQTTTPRSSSSTTGDDADTAADDADVSGSSGSGGCSRELGIREIVVGPVEALQRAVEVLHSPASSSVETGLAGSSRVVTLVLPHDLSWEERDDWPVLPPSLQQPQGVSAVADAFSSLNTVNGSGAPGLIENHVGSSSSHPSVLLSQIPGASAFIKDCASALLACRARGEAVAIYLGGEALLVEGGAVINAGKISAHTGVDLLCVSAFARVDRGEGLPCPIRLQYFPQEAAAQLKKYKMLVVIGTPLPVANFGYKDGPSQLCSLPEENVWELDSAWGAAQALAMLAEELGASKAITPFVNCRGIFNRLSRPALPTGRLTASGVCSAVAALQPKDAIIVDESLTSGGSYWEASRGCPRFSHLTLTGGAIGSGPPMAVGAAIACPSRRVINLQADGSCMYSLQALWTQARERLNVTTIVCANNSYAILKLEAVRQRLPRLGTAGKSLTDLSRPIVDWVALATGLGVPASRATTAEGLISQLKAALLLDGPFLIEAVLV